MNVTWLHKTRSKIFPLGLCWHQYGVLSGAISMWLSNWLVVLAAHVVSSTVSSAGCLECQLVYSSNLVAPSCETVPVGAACIGISLEIYCPIWEGRVCACVCHKRERGSPSTVLIYSVERKSWWEFVNLIHAAVWKRIRMKSFREIL